MVEKPSPKTSPTQLVPKMSRSLSQQPQRRPSSAMAAAARVSSVAQQVSDAESGPETPVFKWGRLKGINPFHSLPHSVRLTCPTPKSAAGRKKAPLVEFNVFYDTFRKTLSVHINRALNLPQRRGLKSIDSYIQAHLEPSKKQTLKTRVVVNSRSPAFDQLLEFTELTFDELPDETLILEVFYKTGERRNRFVSRCRTKLAELDLNTNNQLSKKLEEGVELVR